MPYGYLTSLETFPFVRTPLSFFYLHGDWGSCSFEVREFSVFPFPLSWKFFLLPHVSPTPILVGRHWFARYGSVLISVAFGATGCPLGSRIRF